MANEVKNESKPAALPPIDSIRSVSEQAKSQSTNQAVPNKPDTPQTNLNNSGTGTTLPLSAIGDLSKNIITPPQSYPSTKEMMIGGGALLVLSIIFFIIRGSFENYLVGTLKRSPNSAGMSGWALFGALFFGSALGCVALVNNSYMTLPVIISLSVLSIVCLLLCIIVASKK